jgi:hypothetical protein
MVVILVRNDGGKSWFDGKASLVKAAEHRRHSP